MATRRGGAARTRTQPSQSARQRRVSSFLRRSTSFFKGGMKSFARGKNKGPPLPKNWKMVKEKDSVYYVNTVTNQRSHEPPPPLPKGWKEGGWSTSMVKTAALAAQRAIRSPSRRGSTLLAAPHTLEESAGASRCQHEAAVLRQDTALRC